MHFVTFSSVSFAFFGVTSVALESISGSCTGDVGNRRALAEHWIYVVKLLRAHGGCLGVRRR